MSKLTTTDIYGILTAHSDVNIKGKLNLIEDERELYKEPTGFDDPSAVIITYDSSARTITLTGAFKAYWRGNEVYGLTGGWVSPAHGTGYTVPYFLYYNGTSYVWSSTPWTFDMLMIAYLSFDSSGFRFALRECHGLLDWRAHIEFHQTIGTYSTSATIFTPASYTLSLESPPNPATVRQPLLEAVTIKDEDIITSNPSLSTRSYTWMWLTTGAATNNFSTANAEIVSISGSVPQYNEWTGATWQLTAMPANRYMAVWLFAVPATADTGSQLYRYIWVPGQSVSVTKIGEAALSVNQLNLGSLTSLTPELIAIGRVILKTNALGNNWTIEQVDRLSGTRFAQVANPAGNFLSGVTTDTTLVGVGTGVSPLGLNPTQVYTTTAGTGLSIAVDALTDGKALSITSASTAAHSSTTNALLNLARAGSTVGTATNNAIVASVTSTGTNLTNRAIYAAASGATISNYSFYGNGGLLFNLEGIGIGSGASAISTDRLVYFVKTQSGATTAENFNIVSSYTHSIADTGLKQNLRLSTTSSHTTGTIAANISILSLNSASGNGGTTTSFINYWSRLDTSSGAIVTSSYNNIVYDATGAGTVTNQYGLYISDLTKGATINRGIHSAVSSGSGKYNLYISGNADNYFAGNVAIGGVAPSTTLDVRESGITTTPTGSTANIVVLDTSTLAADTGGAIWLGAYYTGTTIPSQATFIKAYKESAVDGEYGFGLKFGTRVHGSTAAVTATLTGSGNLGIGLTPVSDKLEVKGNVRVNDTSGNIGFSLQYNNTTKTLDFVFVGT